MKRLVLTEVFAFLSFLSCLATGIYPSGVGCFSYNIPSGRIKDTIKVFYYIPDNRERESMQVIVGFHGNDRDCSYWIDTWKEYADKKGFMFFIPWFTYDAFPTRRYQELGVKDENGNILSLEFRTSALVDSLLCYILQTSGTKENKVTIYGHSAGGQFVHRFMLLNNSPFIKKAIIGNPGWFTFPSVNDNYSYGIKDLEDVDNNQIRNLLAKNIILQLAEGDTLRESFLRKTSEADRQRANRLERGNKYFDTLKSIADANHWDFSWRRIYVPDVGHEAVAMSRHASENLLCDSVSVDGIKTNTDWLHRYDDDIVGLVDVSDHDTDTICDVLFVGSSSIRLWYDLKNVMKPLNVKNRGYGGATMRDMMINYHRVFAHYKPKSVVFYCDNDICGWEEGDLQVEDVFSLYKAFINRIHYDYSSAVVYFLSIKHSASSERLREQQEELNLLMRNYAANNPNLIYVDVSSSLLDKDGNVNNALFMDDYLHLNPNGYEMWNKKLKPLLVKQCKNE